MELPSPGDLLNGKYRIARLIGEGGMGSVYEARHEMLGTVVAIKFLDPELSQNPALVGRFLQEARVSATVQSPFVTRVFDVERSPEGGAYLVMELLSGESLGDRLARVGRLAPNEALGIALQVCAGLETAHARGIVHRDLKPENIFLVAGSAGLVKILDFGIAKLKQSAEFVQVVTRPGSMMGTPAYMAPEQAIAADQVDERADIYSLGVILYEMLSGGRPVDDDEPSVIVERVMKGQITSLGTHDPSLPSSLVALVDRTLSANPDKRPSTVAEVRRELATLATALGPAAQLAASDDAEAAALSSVRFEPPRPSGVPKTLPPGDIGTATTVPRTEPPDRAGPPGSVAVPLPAPLPPLAVRPSRTVPDRSPPRSSVVRWGALATLLLGIGVVGLGIAYFTGAFEATSQPPPLPAPPSLTASSEQLRVPPAGPRPRVRERPGTAARPPMRSPSPAVPRGDDQAEGVPLPTIQIPSVLPPIPGLPSTLPTVFPPFGAAPAPKAPAVEPESRPSAPAGSAPAGSAPAP